MEKYLRTDGGLRAFRQLVEEKGLVKQYPGSEGILLHGGIVLGHLIGRTATVIVYGEGKGSLPLRMANLMEDLCELMVITPDDIPKPVLAGNDATEQEQKCVKVWASYVGKPWGARNDTGLVQSGPKGLFIPPNDYMNWECDFIFAIRVFAAFCRCSPKFLTDWNKGWIPLSWKHGLGVKENHLLTWLRSELNQIENVTRDKNIEEFCDAVKEGADNAGKIEGFAIRMGQARMRGRPYEGPPIEELLGIFNTSMIRLAKASNFR